MFVKDREYELAEKKQSLIHMHIYIHIYCFIHLRSYICSSLHIEFEFYSVYVIICIYRYYDLK